MAAPLAEIHGDAEPLVAVVLDGLDFLPAHADRLAEAFRDVYLASRGADGVSVIEDSLRDCAQSLLRVSESLGHAETLRVRKL